MMNLFAKTWFFSIVAITFCIMFYIASIAGDFASVMWTDKHLPTHNKLLPHDFVSSDEKIAFSEYWHSSIFLGLGSGTFTDLLFAFVFLFSIYLFFENKIIPSYILFFVPIIFFLFILIGTYLDWRGLEINN